jgi:hypothetical protein
MGLRVACAPSSVAVEQDCAGVAFGSLLLISVDGLRTRNLFDCNTPPWPSPRPLSRPRAGALSDHTMARTHSLAVSRLLLPPSSSATAVCVCVCVLEGGGLIHSKEGWPVVLAGATRRPLRCRGKENDSGDMMGTQDSGATEIFPAPWLGFGI